MKPKYIIPVLCACICALQPEDSHAQAVKLRKDSTERYFNALDYTLQKRYIPQGKKGGERHAREKLLAFGRLPESRS